MQKFKNLKSNKCNKKISKVVYTYLIIPKFQAVQIWCMFGEIFETIKAMETVVRNIQYFYLQKFTCSLHHKTSWKVTAVKNAIDNITWTSLKINNNDKFIIIMFLLQSRIWAKLLFTLYKTIERLSN